MKAWHILEGRREDEEGARLLWTIDSGEISVPVGWRIAGGLEKG